MHFIHTADWHLGRLFCGIHLTDDQRKVLMESFLPIVDDVRPDAIVIAGDIYDRAVPIPDAVELFDEVLAKLAERKIPLFYIAGNHDNGTRIDFGRRLIDARNIYARGIYDAADKPILLDAPDGPVAVSLLPYVEPPEVRPFFEGEELRDFATATTRAIQNLAAKAPRGMRSIAVAHAFIAGGMPTEDSERPLSVGGADNVPASAFDGFHYAALGHLHNPQKSTKEHIRYSGSLMKYSFSEEKQQKGVLLVEMDDKGEVKTEHLPLTAPHDVRRVRDTLEHCLAMEPSADYLDVTLTDETIRLGARDMLREKWPNTFSVHWEVTDKLKSVDYSSVRDIKKKSYKDLFADFFENTQHCSLNENEQQVLEDAIQAVLRNEREGN